MIPQIHMQTPLMYCVITVGPTPPYTYTKEWQELDKQARTPPTKIGNDQCLVIFVCVVKLCVRWTLSHF